MDVVGSEIGQKMRSAIKAKLTELGCYVDDELPDYVMVMVANKRTRAQMEDDLQLFLGDNTELFVNWLHQVLKKLQEVTIPPIKPEAEKSKEKPKEKKVKEKKDKEKTKLKKDETVKKAKKKDKIKEKLRKKEEKKSHKSKKKSKHHEMIRPNIPPLLMNIEKESEPSITDVFAGQILKNHGILIESPKDEKPETKPVVIEIKKPILPIIDPATILSSQHETSESTTVSADISIPAVSSDSIAAPAESTAAPRDEHIKEINEIEAKIQGLKQKLVDQLDSMSEDEDFLNIRTEAEELMNDFAEDVFQEISSQAPPAATPPLSPKKPTTLGPAPTSPAPKSSEAPKEPPTVIDVPPKAPEPEILPQIELKLPKRPVRERLGAKEDKKKTEAAKEKDVSTKVKSRLKNAERSTPDQEPDFWGKYKSAKSRLGSPPEPIRKSPITFRRRSSTEDSDDSDISSKKKERKTSVVSARVSCASVVRVKPRPRVQPASSLLLRAVADAHKSLLNIPPKVGTEPSKIKRALVHPIRRCIDGQNIVIKIPSERPAGFDDEKRKQLDLEKEDYISAPLRLPGPDFAPSSPLTPLAPPDRVFTKRDDTLIIETLNIHNPTVDKDKNTQFIVTMDGFNPNAFLAKKLKTEGLLDDDEAELTPKESKSVLRIPSVTIKSTTKDNETPSITKEINKEKADDGAVDNLEDKKAEAAKQEKTQRVEKNKGVIEKDQEVIEKDTEVKEKDKEITEKDKEVIEKGKEVIEKEDSAVTGPPQKKRLSDTSDDSDTQVIIKPADVEKGEKRSSIEALQEEDSAPKKRKASPIVFDVVKKDKEDHERTRQRTESASSDNQVTVTTVPKTHKYDTVPPLSAAEKKLVWCRSFPLCRYGAACAFQHPRCKFAAACTRRNCPYAHTGPTSPAPAPVPPPTVASHVVPAASFKSVGRGPTMCVYAAACTNALCPFAHPKPCRYGRACADRPRCNFYHPPSPHPQASLPSHLPHGPKWRYPV